jgi:RNA polymerase sigma-70 factor (ECF subfamily)
MEEQTAISLLKQGNMQGLETLVKTYQVQAVHASQLILRDRGPAEDVVQSAFLRLPDIIQRFDETRPFKPWFMRIIVNDTLKAIRSEQRLVKFSEEVDENTRQMDAWLVDNEDLPEEQVITAETRQTIRNALKSLTPEQRSVIVMRYFLEMKGDEMAQELARPLTTIKWWLHSAKLRLRKLLQ